MQGIRVFLEAQPVLSLFLVIATGYALGTVSIRGFALGVGAVLFTGLILGAIAPKAAPPGMVSTLGLLFFLYGVGIQYGRQFFAGLAGPGLVWNLLALVAVTASLAVALITGKWLGLTAPTAVGLFAGSGTSTAALQSALGAAGNAEPAIGYSVAYPFGVVGPILVIYFATIWLKPKVEKPQSNLRHAEVTVDRPEIVGLKIRDVMRKLPDGLNLMAVRRDHSNIPYDENLVVQADDALLLVGSPAVIDEAIALVGRPDPQRITKDRRDLDVVRVFVSKPAMFGRPLSELPKPGFPMRVSHIKRGDLDMLATPDLVIESGDRLIVLAPADKVEAVRAHFGDFIRATAEFSYISIGVGLVIGLAVGLIPIPVPGFGTFTLGVAGGPLLVALVLGKLGRTGPISWAMPAPANLVLRNLGLTLFLAAVAMSAGKPFVDTVATTGIPICSPGLWFS